MGNNLPLCNNLPSRDPDQVLGFGSQDSKGAGYIDQEMILSKICVRHHIQWGDLLIHPRDNPPIHG
jgi:hypothetical protein